MPTYSFENKSLDLSLELDFQNEPTKQDIYDVIKTQVDQKQMFDLVNGSDEDKAFLVDAYRSGYFEQPEEDVDVLGIIGDGFKNFGQGVGELLVDNSVATKRLKNLAKSSGGLTTRGSNIPMSYSSPAMPIEMQLVDVSYPGEMDNLLKKKVDRASVRVLEDSLNLKMSWEDQDAQNILSLALANEDLDMNDKDLRAEVSRRANELFKLKNRATLYQTITNYAGGYAMLGSLMKRELHQSDWFSSTQSDKDVLEEIKHLKTQYEVVNVMEKGAITGAQVIQNLGFDDKYTKMTEDALRQGLIKPDEEQALALEVIASPENLATPLATMTAQNTIRKFASGQLNRLNNELLLAKEAYDEAQKGLQNLRNGRQVNQSQVNLNKVGPDDAVSPKQILDPETYKGIERALEKQLFDSKKIIDELSPKLFEKINQYSKPPLLRKGLGGFTYATGVGLDVLGRTTQWIRGVPKELGVDLLMKANKNLTPQSAEQLLLTLGGTAGIGVGALQISNENWQPDWWDALTALSVMLGPRVARSGGQTLKHTGQYWMSAQGSKNLAQHFQQLNTRPSLSDALVDRSTDTGMMHTLKSSAKIFEGATKAGGIGETTRNFARGATATGMDKVGDFIGRTTMGASAGTAMPGAMGYAIGGERGMAEAIGPNLWFVGSGVIAGEYVRAKSLNDLAVKQRGDITNYSKGLSESQGNLYKMLNPVNQAGIASISQKYPDLEIKLIADEEGGNGAYHFRNGSPIAYINVLGDAPLTNILAHEVGHHILRHGLSPLVHEIFFGSVASEKPGVFTALDDEGKPIIEYENGVPQYKLNDEFEEVRNAYVERLENTPGIDEDTRMGYSTNPTDILEEVVAEHVAHKMIHEQSDPGILNMEMGQLAKSLFSAISGKGFIRDSGVGLGLATNEFGNGLLPIKENKELSKLIDDFEKLSSRRSEGEMGDMLEEGFSDDIANVTPAKLKSNPALMKLFNNQIVLDANGNPELTLTGLPKLMTNAQINKRQKQMSTDLSDLLEKAGDKPNGHVTMKETADGEMNGEGLYIDDSIINELAKSGNYSASQINFLKQVSGIGKKMAIDNYTGNEVLMFYYPAMKGGKYKSLRGGYRSMLLWGIKVSKANNIYFQTLSLTAMENNLSRMLKTKKYSKDLYEAFGGDSQIEVRKNIRKALNQYLDNHHKGRSNDDGSFGIDKRQKNILNALMGENVQAQTEANPYLANLGFRPENAVKSRRLDRIGSIETTNRGGYVDYYKIKHNHMPKIRVNPNQLELNLDSLLEQNPNMSAVDAPPYEAIKDKSYIKDLANKILDRIPMSTDDAGMLEGIALNYAEEHGVMPSDLEEALFTQFFKRAGYRMPRLDGLSDNGHKALRVVGQDKFSVQQWNSALSKVPGARAYMEDLGLDFHTQPAKLPNGKDAMLTKEQIAKAIELNKLSFSSETFRGSAGHYAGAKKLSTPGKVTSDNDYVEMLTYFKGGGKYGDPLGLDIDYRVIVKDENIDRFKELFEKSGIDVELVGKYKDSEIYASEQGLTDELFPMARPETSEDRGAFNLFKFKFGADSVDLNRRSFASQYADTRDKFNQTLIKNLLDIDNEKKSFDEVEVEYANRIASSFEIVDENPIERPGIKFSDLKGHWRDRPNIFAWTRATGRTNEAEGGKKVRHMEEVQSDWQKLYRDQQPKFPSERLNIPEPPMQSNWYQLAIKRQMLEAFDNGFDQFSFTQGRVQNDRYDLSDQINIIDLYNGRKYMHGDYIKSGVKNFKPIKDYKVVGLDLSNHGYQRLVMTEDGMIIDTLDEFDDAVGKPLSDIVGKVVADKILSIKEGEKFDPVRKVPPALKKIVDKKHAVLEKVLNDELAGLRKGRKRMPLPEDEMVGSLIDDYEFAVAKKAIDEFDDILEEIYGTPDLDKIQAQIRKAKDPEANGFKYGNVEVSITDYIKKGTDVIKRVQGNEILTYVTDLDSEIIGDAIDSGIISSAEVLYEYFDQNYDKHYNNVVIKGTSPNTSGLGKNLQNEGRIGSYKPEGLDFQDPKLLKFYDGVIRKAVDKMAKKMGVEKTRSISFDDEDPNLQDGWVIDLPKERSKIEGLGLFMPRLGDKIVNEVPSVPLAGSSRSLQLQSEYLTKSVDKVHDELVDAEIELEKYARPDEKMDQIDPEGSEFVSKRNQAINKVSDLKEVMGKKLMPSLREEFFEWEWASDAVQNFMTHNGKPYFAKKINESFYPKFWFHGGELGFKFHPEGDFKESPKGAWAVGNPESALFSEGKTGLRESADAIFLSSDEKFSEGYQLGMTTATKRRRDKELRPERPQQVKDVNAEYAPRPLRVITNVSNVFDARIPKHQKKLIKFLKKHGIDDFMWNSVAHKQNNASTSPYFDKKLAEKHFREKISDPMNNWGTIEELALWNDGQSFFYDGTKPKFANQSIIRAMGYEAFVVTERGTENLAVYNSNNIKLWDDAVEVGPNTYWGKDNELKQKSRVGLVKGSFDPNEPDIRYLPRVEKVIASSNFKNWFGDSKIVTPSGKPLVLYRGVRRKPKDGVFGLTQGRRTPSFTEVPEVANLYAHEPQMFGGVKPKGSVFPVFLAMQNPLDMYEPELVRATLTEHLDKFGDDYYPQNAGNTKWFDVHNLLGLLYDLESTGQTNAEVNWSSGLEAYQINSLREAYNKVSDMLDNYDPDTGITLMENSYGDEIEITEDEFIYYIQDLTDSIVVDQYSIADSPTIINYAKKRGYDGIIHADTIAGGAEFFPRKTIAGREANKIDGIVSVDEDGESYNQYIDDDSIIKTYRPFEPNQIKSAIGNQSFDPNTRDLRYMPLLNLPGTKDVQFKQNKNLIPIVFDDISRIAGKHVTFVEADRHDTDLDRMGGPLHAFLKSNDVIINVDGATFRPQWANLAWNTISGMINRIKVTDEGHALITLMHEDAHRSNKMMLSAILEGFEGKRHMMSSDEKMFLANAINLIRKRHVKGGKLNKDQSKFLSAIGPYKSSLTSGKNVQQNFDKIISKYKRFKWWHDADTIALSKDFRLAKKDTTFNARADIANMFMRSEKGKSAIMPFAPDVDALLLSQMDYHGGKKDDVVGVVQLSKHKLDSKDRVFAVYFGDDPTQARWMTANEVEAKKQLLANKNFRPHPSYDWLMLGPGDADFFMFNQPYNTNKILTTEFSRLHEMEWRNKVAKLQSDYIKKYKRPTPYVPKKNFKNYTKPSKEEQKAYKDFLNERAKTPLSLQDKSNKTGAFLRKGGFANQIIK